MGKYKFNPISSDFDMTGSSGASVVDREVATPADLPITLGTPDVGSVYLALSSSGVWLVNYKPSGLYKRVSNDGDADDWTYLGAFDGKFNNDVEITDPTKGLILTNGTNRVRLTLGADNQLVRTVLSILLACGMALSANAQIARDVGLDASNRVVTGITNGNPVTFTNPLAFGTNAATTRINLGLGWQGLTNTNAAGLRSALGAYGVNDTPIFTSAQFTSFAGDGAGLVAHSDDGDLIRARDGNSADFRQQLGLGYLGTNAATTISSLFASNSLPSGAAAAGAPLLADGSGLSAFSTPTRWAVSGGTVTSNVPLLDLSQTWSNSATAFIPFSISISNAASSNTSRFLSFGRNGAAQIQVGTNGQIWWPQGASVPGFGVQNGNLAMTLFNGGSPMFAWGNNWVALNSGMTLEWASIGDASNPSSDIRLGRDGPGSLGQRNGTNSQTNNIYGTFTNSTNYRRLSIGMSNNGIGFIRPEQAGPSTNGTNIIYISGLPTTNTGLPSGVLWVSNGVVAVTP